MDKNIEDAMEPVFFFIYIWTSRDCTRHAASSGASIKNKSLIGIRTPSCSKRERRMFSASQDVYENCQLYEDPSPL